MIKESTPLTLAEVSELAGEGETAEQIKEFIKRFTKMSVKKAREVKEELQKLDLIKLNEEQIVKIVDFMPEDATDLTKVLPGASLDQDEINKILAITTKK